MSSQPKCPKCGHINKADMPMCTKCGGAIPPQDEDALMRQTMGASYDFKWVAVGGIIILALQFGTIALIWQIAGKKFLIGQPRRSLLEASIESVDEDYGYYKKSNEVKILIKLDKNKKNTAPTVTSVYFGSKKSVPYIHEKVKRETKQCKKFCAEGGKAKKAETTCNATCKKAKDLIAEGKKCDRTCREKCDGECTEEKLLTLTPEEKTTCETCPKKSAEGRKLAAQCDTCTKRVEYLKYQGRKCENCDVVLANLKKDAKKCQSNGEDCYSRTDYSKREELERKKKNKPKKRPDEKSAAYEKRLKSWKRGIERTERELFTSEKRTAYAYSPAADGPKTVPVQLRFSSGYRVSKSPGYFYLKTPTAKKPDVKKKKTRDDPTRHAGFWIMLGISLVVYFLGGMFTGRLSPGITMKEPATAGVFSGVIYFVFLMAIGADFSVVIFSGAIGIVAFAGAAFVGGWVGEKWQGTI